MEGIPTRMSTTPSPAAVVRTGLRVADGRFSVTLAVTNALDNDAREWANDSILYPGGFLAIQEFQRNWSLQTQWKY